MTRSKTDNGLKRFVTPQPVIRDYAAVVLRGKWTILITTFLVLVGAFLFTKLRPPEFQATASVLIMTQNPELRGLFVPAVGSAIITNVRQNEIEILRSQSLAETVARQLINQMFVDSAGREPIEIIKPAKNDKTARTVAPVDQIVKRLGQAVDFVPVRESDVIKIVAKSRNPKEAALLANLYAMEYYNRNVYKSREKSRALREFLQLQVDEQRENLERLEGALQSYMEKKGIIALDAESRKMIDQLSQLEAARDAADISLQSLERTVALYRQEIPQQERMLMQFIATSDDPYIRNLQEQIATLEVQRDVAVAKNPALAGTGVFGDKVKEVEGQIKGLYERLRARTKEYVESLVPSPATGDQANVPPSLYLRQVKQKLVETQIEIQALRAKKDALNKVIADYERQFERIPGKSIQFARLERGKLSAEKLFVVLSDKLNEATIAEQSQFGYIDIIDHAAVPLEPSSPVVFLNLGVGFALGVLLGCAIVFGKEYRDVRIHAPEDLKLKGFSPSAVIPRMEREIKRLKGNVILARSGRPVDPHLVTLAEAPSPIAEAYRSLRAAIQFEPTTERQPQTILVSSPNKDEGASTTAANLAVVFAQAGRMVLLIDANMRHPAQHRLFQVAGRPGLSDLLQDRVGYDGVVQVSVLRNLHILTAGTLPTNPAELVASEKMKEVIQQAEIEYDIVLLDTPPILAVSDAAVLSTYADCAVLVIAAGVTRMEELERSVETIQRFTTKTPKYVLNKFDQRRAYGISYRRSGYGSETMEARPARKLIGRGTGVM